MPEALSQKEIVDIKVKREEEFPSDPEKRFEAVFSAIGNSEAKCLTLLCLSQSPTSSWDLYQRFLTENGKVWNPTHRVPSGYCVNTLIPIGLVVEADTLYHGATEYVTGFRLTEAGQKYGQPIAAFLLQKSAQSPHSLLEILGPTAKGPGETRSVMSRAKILESLYQENKAVRTIDLITQLGLDDAVVSRHLGHLAKLGLVEYSAINTEEGGYVKYTLSQDANKAKIKTVYTDAKLTAEVAHLLFKFRMVDSRLLAEKLKDKHPKRSAKNLRHAIGDILSGLAKQGICHHELFIAREIQSQGRITQAGRNFVSEVIKPIKQASSGDENLLSQWRRISWQTYAKEAILKYEEASGYASPRALEESVQEILRVISQNPGIRPKEMRSILDYQPSDFLKILINQGRIRKEKEGRAVRYYAIEAKS